MNDQINLRNFLLMVTGSIAGASAVPDDVQAARNFISHVDSQQANIAVDRDSITDNSAFYVQNYSASLPALDREAWTLTIDGLINSDALTLTWRDLQGLPTLESTRTLECIGNPVGGSLVGNVVWKGFDFGALLNRISIQAQASRVRFTAADGYQTAVDIDWLRQPGVMLAFEMNGESLPQEHGYPLRLIIPGLYGQKMPKWIKHIEFIDYPFMGHWESRGWSDTADVQTHAIITHPRSETRISDAVILQGIAFAGLRQITRVDVRIDGGHWIPAQLSPGESTLEWTLWQLQWQPEQPGKYSLEVRATDSSGFTQYEAAGDIFSNARPNGNSTLHRITLEVTA